MDVQIKNFDPLEVAFVRHTGPYAKCTWAWNRICSWAESQHLIGPKTLFIGLSHDDPTVTPADKIRYDACITANGQIQVQDGISLTTIPGGDYAVFLHTGPYENLEAVYRAIYSQWLPTSGRKLRGGTPLEIYLNHPDQTPPEELLTEIRIPLEPAV